MDIVAILGADDPEMQAIEGLLTEAGVLYMYAMVDNRRVHPGNAYMADGIDGPLPHPCTIWAIECDGPAIEAMRLEDYRVVTIDHHRPGNPGYGRPPAEFMPASSIGQILELLATRGWHPNGWEFGEESDHIHQDERWIQYDGDPMNNWALTIPDRDCVPWYGSVSGIVVYPPQHIRFIAASDHCLGAAYKGQCPGVDPDALMQWRTG